MRLAALVALAALLCACSHKRHIAPPRASMAWQGLKAACTVDAGLVTCDKGPFRAALRGCIETGRSLEHRTAQLVACRSMTAVDRAECMGALEACQQKLADPWRSPWLWGVVGLAVGVVSGFAAGLGSR